MSALHLGSQLSLAALLAPELVVLLLIVIVLFAYMAVARTSRAAERDDTESTKRWESAIDDEESQVGKMLLGVARRLSAVPAIYENASSPQYRYIQGLLLSAGGVFAGSVEIFLALQVLCLFISSLMVVGVLLAGVSDGLILAGTALFAVAFAAYPYNMVSKKAKDRLEAVDRGLPEFAELMLMPLSSGTGVLPALAFTAERLEGPVAEEVKNLLTVIRSRSMTEQQAFLLAAERLGTPEASAFFTALMQAYTEGAKVAKNLAGQAEALRLSAHQKERAKIARLPNKFPIIFGLHLLPFLFVVALVPTLVALGSM